MTDETNKKIDALDRRMEGYDRKLETFMAKIDARPDAVEKHMVTRSDVNGAVLQNLALVAALIVSTIVVLRATGVI